MAKQLLHYEEWVKRVQGVAITISDIISLKKGTETKLLMLDRHVKDLVLDKHVNKPNIKHDATEFFQKKCVYYIHDTHLKGYLIYHNENKKTQFEFQVESAPDFWHQVSDSILMINQEGSTAYVPYELLPTSTKVGWQGPMVLWEDVKQMDKLFYIYY